MNPGALNKRITIQSPLEVPGDYGEPTTQWTDVISTFASIRAATSKEVYAAQGYTSQITHLITIRWRPGIRSNQRVIYRDRLFEIQAVTDPDERRAQLNLLCIEINGPETA
jgi:SPP1 family predicted phage head-tail adaptor